MTRDDAIKIMSILKASYPAYYRDITKADAYGIINLWAEMFADDPAPVVAAAVKAHIASDKKGFPPHIGAIKDAIYKISNPESMSELEAWGHVAKALRNSGYNSESEFSKLPEMIQRIVGSPAQLREWAVMDSETINSVVASNFQRSYKARAATDRELTALPSDVRQTMTQIAAGMKMQALTEG